VGETELTQEAIVKYMSKLDCFTWITQNNLELGAGPWSLTGHEYQVGMLQERTPRQCFIKGG